MDALDALAIGLHYREQAPVDDPVKDITDRRLMDLIEQNLKAHKAPRKPSTTYADPTGNEAACRADRRKR